MCIIPKIKLTLLKTMFKNMKKINLERIKENLTKVELNKIMAGSGDITNTNSTQLCICKYNNNSVITNSNSITGCFCQCV
jgi:hypothetical protein